MSHNCAVLDRPVVAAGGWIDMNWSPRPAAARTGLRLLRRPLEITLDGDVDYEFVELIPYEESATQKAIVEPCNPWLCQGDVFADVPWVLVSATHDWVTAEVESGAGLLITENSQLDKRSRGGRSSIPILQFLPLRPVAEVDANIQHGLRTLALDPPGAVYVGRAPSVGPGDAPTAEEMFGFLAEAYPIPAQFFRLEMTAFQGSLFADPEDPVHAVATSHDTRIGRLSEDQLRLLREKMLAYWLKIRPNPVA